MAYILPDQTKADILEGSDVGEDRMPVAVMQSSSATSAGMGTRLAVDKAICGALQK